MIVAVARRSPATLAVLLALAGCSMAPPSQPRPAAESASPGPTEAGPSEPAGSSDAGESAQGGSGEMTEASPMKARRTDRAPERRYDAACARMRNQVDVTYRLPREPGPTGQRIWLELSLTNRSDARLAGETGGEVLITHPVHSRMPPWIEWGGSSADSIAVPARSTSTRRIYTVAGTKLHAHTDSRVSLVGVYTHLADGGVACAMPARMRAPAGLVLHRPRGCWILDVATGERLRIQGFKRMLDVP